MPDLIPRPNRNRRQILPTFADAVDRVMRVENISIDDTRAINRIAEGVRSALEMFATYSDAGFKYYHDRYVFNAPGAEMLAALTIAADGTVTVNSGETLPTWLEYGHLRLGTDRTGIRWLPVVDALVGNNTQFVINNYEGAIEAGTHEEVWIEQSLLPLPSRFRRRGVLIDGNDRFEVQDVSADKLHLYQDWYEWSRSVNRPRLFAAITNDSRWQGAQFLALWPAYANDTQLSMFWERYPHELDFHRVGAGLVSTTGSSNIVNSDTAEFDSLHIGTTFNWGTDEEIRKPGSFASLRTSQRMVVAVNSPTQIQLDQAVTIPTPSPFYLSDPLDLRRGTMSEAFYRMCEYEIARQLKRPSGHLAVRRREWIDAFELAMADDDKAQSTMSSMGQPDAVYSTIGRVNLRG